MRLLQKKRIIWAFLWLTLLGCALVILGISFYRLYIEAEKAQRTAFTGKVLLAGQEIATNISDSVFQSHNRDGLLLAGNKDSTEIRTKTTFLIDKRPIALIKETITIYRGETASLDKDTTYFETESDADSVLADSLFYETFLKDNGQINIITQNDSLFSTIDRRLLRTEILNVLNKYNIITSVDFCIYNLPSNSYVLPPSSKHHDYDILNKGYVFSIPNDESHAHYLILYFPEERSFFLQRLSEIVTTIVLLIVLITILVIALIFAWSRQKKNEEVKNNFISNITHEFKTPIATIALACEAFADESLHQDPDSQRAFIKIIQDENNRLQKMVNNILQLARLRRGQLKLNKEIVHVNNLLDSIIKNITLQVSARKGKLTMKYETTNDTIFADISHIENVLINLIENALKYSNEQPVIAITTRNENNMVVIAISDNGIGIAKKELRHIFNEFYRIQKGNVQDVEGYGLGLNYVKKIVHLHGGNIMVESILKKGSTFTIYLPINK